MNPFREKPMMVQLTDMRAMRIPHGDTWMVFDVDSVAPSCMHPGEWNCHIRDYRYGQDPAGMLGRTYQVWVPRPGDYEPI
jgi:hypothetical protein